VAESVMSLIYVACFVATNEFKKVFSLFFSSRAHKQNLYSLWLRSLLIAMGIVKYLWSFS